MSEMKGTSGMTLNATVIRGPESWTYIYIFLGFAISIEGTIIQMITPLSWPYNLLLYVVAGAFTFWLFIFNGRFQNKLISLKLSYENKAR